MQNINIKNSQEAVSAYTKNIGTYEQKQGMSSTGTLDAFEAVEQVQYDRSSKVKTNAQTVMDNFKEYQKDQQEKTKEEQQQEIDDEKQAREDAKEIARSLTTEEIKQLRRMGVDVATASLSDIEGIVNAMREASHKDEVANIFAQAKVEKGDVSGLVFTSTGPKIAGTDVNLNVENKDILYLLKNRQPLTQETLYKAHYSGQQDATGTGQTWKESTNANPVGQAWEELPETIQMQCRHIIQQAGIPVDDKSMGGASLMLANDIPVTTDSMRAYMALQAQNGKSITALPTMDQIEETQADAIGKMAGKLCEDVASLTENDVVLAIRENRPLTIAAMLAARQNVTGAAGTAHETTDAGAAGAAHETADVSLSQSASGRMLQTPDSENPMTQQSLREITARRQLEEIRLNMTQNAAVRMLKQDINIDTRDLAQVVAKLRNAETQMTKELFARNGVAASEENVALYKEVQRDLQTIGAAPAEKLGLLVREDTRLPGGFAGGYAAGGYGSLRMISVHGLAELVSTDATVTGSESVAADTTVTETIRRPADFAAMEREYDALGTSPRADMGDSIRKAFANVDAILQDMHLPADAEHTRAVRILGYNSIAITEENLQQVIQYDREVNDLLTACRPNTVLSMIRDGINPLDLSVEELNQTLRDRNYQPGVKETDDFAAFLRDVEQRGEISKDERSGYIGIYRVLKKLEKSGDREAGYLFANGSRLTVRNLITAMRSRKAAGIDVSVDEAFGMQDTLEVRGNRMDAQIEAAFLASPDQAAVPDGAEKNPWQEIAEETALDETEAFLREQKITESAQNIQAADIILHGGRTPENADIYSLLAQVMKNMHVEDHATEDAIDEETGSMAKSLAGEEIPLPFEPDNLLEQLGRGEDLSLTYADLQQQLVEQMYIQAEAGQEKIDFQNLRLVQAGFRILGTMAKQQRYQLPVSTERGTRLVNLTLQAGADGKGTVDIKLPSRRFGVMTAMVHVDAEGQWNVTIHADATDGNSALQSQRGMLDAMLTDSPYAGARISIGQNRQTDAGHVNDQNRQAEAGNVNGQNRQTEAGRAQGQKVETRKLCEAAVFFVKAMTKLSDI